MKSRTQRKTKIYHRDTEFTETSEIENIENIDPLIFGVSIRRSPSYGARASPEREASLNSVPKLRALCASVVNNPPPRPSSPLRALSLSDCDEIPIRFIC